MIPLSVETILYLGAVGLIVIGVFGVVVSTHLLRMVLALAVAETGGNLLLVLAGYRPDAIAPIIGYGAPGALMVDPVPQALVLTSIVIGVGVQALAVALLVRVYRAYGTLDLRSLVERMQGDVAQAAGIPRSTSTEAPVGERPLPPIPGGARHQPQVGAVRHLTQEVRP
jgi:multisubunit Na+/H+ antiporter MnhC subunit